MNAFLKPSINPIHYIHIDGFDKLVLHLGLYGNYGFLSLFYDWNNV